MLTGRPLYTNGHFRLGIPNNVMPLPNPRGFANVLTRGTTLNYAQSQKAPQDDRVLVEVSSVTKTASAIVGIFSAASLILGAVTQFNMVHPFVAAVAIVAAVCFYLMG